MASRSDESIYAETLAVFDERESPFEPLTTPEVAAALDANRRTVYKRLQKLADRGQVNTKETGANSRVWWRSPADSPALQDTGAASTAGRERDSTRRTGGFRRRLDEAPDGIVVHTATGEVLEVNDTLTEMLGYTRETLLSMQIFDFERDFDEKALREYWKSMNPGSMEKIEVEGLHRRKDGSTYPVEVWVSRVAIDDGEDQFIAQIRDITERKQRERELERYERIIDAVGDPVYELDENGQVMYVNNAFLEISGFEREEIVGQYASKAMGEADLARAESRIRNLLADDSRENATIEYDLRTKDGRRIPVENHFTTLTDEDGEFYGTAGILRDISERKERKQELRETARQLEGILDTVEAAIFLKDANGQYLKMNQNCREILGVADTEDVTGMIDEDVFPEEVAAQYRADDREVLESKEGIETEEEVPTTDGLRTYLTRKTPLFDEQRNAYAICAVAADITERKERERKLERQREQLEALNHLHEVVRGITDAVIDQPTRSEIEQVVCNQLTNADSYKFAGICATDTDMQFEPHAKAGFDAEAEEAPFFCGVDSEANQTPIERSMQTGEMEISQHLLEDDESEPLHEHAHKYGYRSVASIPISHEDMIYGAMTVATERADAFAEGEREVIARLGEVVGHAIAAVERKRALMGDELVELAFRMHDVEDIGLPTTDDGKIVFDRIVPLDENTYLEYGTATGDMMETVSDLVDAELTPHSGPINIISESDEQTRFELRLTDPPFLPAITDVGGYVHEARIEDGKYHIRIHLPPSVNVRRIVNVVTDSFPAAQMVTRRQTTLSTPKPRGQMQRLEERLTDRQAAVLKAGYFGGFFEWPRDRSGEELAQSLGIGASTFHQHMRKAEKKLVDQLFNET